MTTTTPSATRSGRRPADDIDDVTLALRAQDGDIRAFEVLLRRNQLPMYRVALKILGDPSDAEDAVQEAFVSAWRRLEHYRADAAFTTWLYRIVTNRCLNMTRSRQRHPTTPLHHEERVVAAVTSVRPEDAAELDAELDALSAAVAALPVEQRVCWVLRENDGLGYDEIAEIVGATPTAVRGRLHRGRQQLARAMKGWQ